MPPRPKNFDPPTFGDIEDTTVFDDTQIESDPVALSVTKQIQDDVRAKIASKFMKVSGSVGKVDFLKLPADIDYTAGGMLSPRWVRKTDKDISRRKDEGYYFPQEISAHLKNITRGSLVLMVCLSDTKKAKEAALRKKSASLIGTHVSNVKRDANFTELQFEP